MKGTYSNMVKEASVVKTRKDCECNSCNRIIRKGQLRYKYDSGFKHRKYESNATAEWWNMHIPCYQVEVKLALKKLLKIEKSFSELES